MTKVLENYHNINEEGISVFSLILMGKIMLMENYKPFIHEIEGNESI